MTLAWKRPKTTGGSKITAYYLDKREAGSLMWKEASSTPATNRVYKVLILTVLTLYTNLIVFCTLMLMMLFLC